MPLRYALTYGIISGAIIIAIIILTMVIELPTHLQAEWFGYLVMLTALSMIFVGVKRFRDVERGGVIRFGSALGVGLAIAGVAAIIYVIGWELFLATSGRDFMAEYMAGMADRMRAEGASAALITDKSAELQVMADAYRNPLYRIPITFSEIAPVGILVALVSAAILRNPKVLPARAG